MRIQLSFLVVVFSLVGCGPNMNPDDKIAIYEELIDSIDKYSTSIDSRDVNWDSLTTVYRPLITTDLKEDDFFEVISDFLINLKDPHVRLISPDRTMQTIDFLGYQRNRESSLLMEHVSNVQVHSETIYSGLIADDIGYLFCADFKGDIDINNDIYIEVLKKFSNTRGLVIDLRTNDGGSVYNAQNLLNKLTRQKRLWHTTQNKIQTGLDQPFEWYIMPDNSVSYEQKVVVLTGRYTISAGERFVMGARLLDQVSTVGDTTASTQGSVMGREMLNGWEYTFTFEKVLDANKMNYAGIGIPPDHYLPPDQTIIDNVDLALEMAIEIINN